MAGRREPSHVGPDLGDDHVGDDVTHSRDRRQQLSGRLDRLQRFSHVRIDLPSDGLGAADSDQALDPLTGEIDALGNDWGKLGWKSTGLVSGQLTNLGWANTSWSASAWSNLGWTNDGWSSSDWKGFAWTNLGWDNNGWDNLGWDNLGWDNLGWFNNGWDNNGWESLGWGRAMVLNVGCGVQLVGEYC